MPVLVTELIDKGSEAIQNTPDDQSLVVVTLLKYGHGSTAPYKKERQRCNGLVCDRVKQVCFLLLVRAGPKRLHPR